MTTTIRCWTFTSESAKFKNHCLKVIPVIQTHHYLFGCPSIHAPHNPLTCFIKQKKTHFFECVFFQIRIFGIYLKCEKLFADVGENFKQLILGIFGDKNLKIIVPPPLFAEEGNRSGLLSGIWKTISKFNWK